MRLIQCSGCLSAVWSDPSENNIFGVFSGEANTYKLQAILIFLHENTLRPTAPLPSLRSTAPG